MMEKMHDVVLSKGRWRTVSVVVWTKNPDFTHPMIDHFGNYKRVQVSEDAMMSVDANGTREYVITLELRRLRFPDLWIGLGDDGEVYANADGPDVRYGWDHVCVGQKAFAMLDRGEITPSEAFWNTASFLSSWEDWTIHEEVVP